MILLNVTNVYSDQCSCNIRMTTMCYWFAMLLAAHVRSGLQTQDTRKAMGTDSVASAHIIKYLTGSTACTNTILT